MAEYRSQKTGPGVVIFFATVALLFLIMEVRNLWPSPSKDLVLYFESVNGVKERTPVSYAGRRCGEVSALRILTPEEVQKQNRKDDTGKPYYVEIKVSIRDYVPINRDTKPSISMLGMLGDKAIDLTPGDPKALKLAPGEGLYGESAGFEKIISTVRKLANKLEPMMEHLELLLANVNDVMKDPKFKDNLKSTIANARVTLEKAQATLENAKEMLGENRENIKLSLANVRELTEKAKTTLAHLNDTLTDTKPKIQTTLENVQRLTAELRAKIDELMVKLGATLDKTGATLDTAQGILSDNRESIAMLMASMRDTGYNAKQFTHTFRLIFAPWSAFSSQKKPEPKPEKPPRSSGRVKVLSGAATVTPPPRNAPSGSSISEPARDSSKPFTAPPRGELPTSPSPHADTSGPAKPEAPK